ncbi:MAG: hypothetical protein ACTSSA_15005 [Candidatus Freyarchaeota archaeon]
MSKETKTKKRKKGNAKSGWVTLAISQDDLAYLKEFALMLYGEEYGSLSKALRYLIRTATAQLLALSELQYELEALEEMEGEN